jgi:hypothetical protein
MKLFVTFSAVIANIACDFKVNGTKVMKNNLKMASMLMGELKRWR